MKAPAVAKLSLIREEEDARLSHGPEAPTLLACMPSITSRVW